MAAVPSVSAVPSPRRSLDLSRLRGRGRGPAIRAGAELVLDSGSCLAGPVGPEIRSRRVRSAPSGGSPARRSWDPDELALLREAYAAAPGAVFLRGEAGVGKSRLVAEFLAGVEDLRGSSPARACPAAG